MIRKSLVLGGTALILGSCIIAAPGRAAESGADTFKQYCAGCHGADGRGNGPETGMIAGIKPPDLTLITKRHGGTFPFQEVEDAIDGRKQITSHKRFDMPFWGVSLQEPGQEFTPASEAKVKQRIDAVVRYIETIQRE